MTDSLGELRVVLAGVGEQLGEALGYAATARDRLSDALGLLTALDARDEAEATALAKVDGKKRLRKNRTEAMTIRLSPQRRAQLVRLSDALGLLTALDGQHSEPLVPPELRRAGDELDHGLRLISSGAAVVADIGTRL